MQCRLLAEKAGLMQESGIVMKVRSTAITILLGISMACKPCYGWAYDNAPNIGNATPIVDTVVDGQTDGADGGTNGKSAPVDETAPVEAPSDSTVSNEDASTQSPAEPAVSDETASQQAPEEVAEDDKPTDENGAGCADQAEGDSSKESAEDESPKAGEPASESDGESPKAGEPESGEPTCDMAAAINKDDGGNKADVTVDSATISNELEANTTESSAAPIAT